MCGNLFSKSKLKETKEVKKLLKKLEESKSSERLVVLRTIYQKNLIDYEEVKHALRRITMNDHETSEHRVEALSILNDVGYLNDNKNVLLSIIENDDELDLELKCNAVLILCSLSNVSKDNIFLVRSIFESTSQSPKLRKYCAMAIGQMRRRKDLSWFMRVLEDEENHVALEGLCAGIVNYKSHIPKGLLDVLLDKFWDTSCNAQIEIIKVLRASNNPNIIQALYELYDNVRRENNCNPQITSLIMECLIDTCKASKTATQYMTSVEILLKALRDPGNSFLINKIVEFIIQHGNYNLKAIRQLLADDNKELRLNIIYITGYLRDKEALPQLKSMLKSSEDEYQKKMIKQAINLIENTI
jgi:flagellar biosynthesis regulator FlbT